MLGLTNDAADQAYYWPDIAAIVDGDSDSDNLQAQVEEEIEKRARKAAAIVCNHIVCTILGYSNPRLALIAYAIAHGLGGLGEHSVREWASKLGVTKQDLSKEITWFRDVYNLEAMGALKTNHARNGYRKAQNERYKRKSNGDEKHFGFVQSYRRK